IVLIEQCEHDERQEHHAQHRELVGRVQQLPYQLTPPCRDRADPRSPARKRSGLSLVLLANRCESEGIPGAPVSSSIRSTLCMGKNTRLGSNASPLCSIEAESSKQFRSSPRILSPAAASSTIAPQNFSRGLFSVTSTIAPGTNGFPCAPSSRFST